MGELVNIEDVPSRMAESAPRKVHAARRLVFAHAFQGIMALIVQNGIALCRTTTAMGCGWSATGRAHVTTIQGIASASVNGISRIAPGKSAQYQRATWCVMARDGVTRSLVCATATTTHPELSVKGTFGIHRTHGHMSQPMDLVHSASI
jgi:hypothetical protein